MSRTLFRYVLFDLLRIFLLTAAALAGVMSFGGLLQPLVRHGVDLSQTLQILYYILPAMSTYSLPIAALFATTLVYGRLSADNELTAMRAAGLSYLSIATPAVVLGLVVSLLSLLLLCFVVPVSTLQVEKVIYSNIARYIATSIERRQEFRIPSGPVVLADAAEVLPTDPAHPRRQAVRLINPTIVNSRFSTNQTDPATGAPLGRVRTPDQFFTASVASLTIEPTSESSPSAAASAEADEMQIFARFENGISFPRDFASSSQGGIALTTFGPQIVSSPVRENTRFMDLLRLRALLENPALAQRVKNSLAEANRNAQRLQIMGKIKSLLESPSRSAALTTLPAKQASPSLSPTTTAASVYTITERYIIAAPPGSKVAIVADELRIEAPPSSTPPPTAPPTTPPSAQSPVDTQDAALSPDAPVIVRYTLGSSGTETETLRIQANRIGLRFDPDTTRREFVVELTAEQALTTPTGSPSTFRKRYRDFLSLPMDDAAARLATRSPDDIAATSPEALTSLAPQLRRSLVITTNEVTSELNSRASFAVSCIVLVLVGCSLGILFRSGHALTAFGVSVVPALLCIMLNVSGRHTAENVPQALPADWSNPLSMGLTLMWLGNVIVAIAAAVLLTKLQRT